MKTVNDYDLILKGGEVIDPAQGIHGKRDIGICDGKIAAIKKQIPESQGKKVIPLHGKLVTPGLIDIHCHASHGVLVRGAHPDYAGLDSGVSMICDAGSAGAGNFPALREFVVEPARTKMFCDINLATNGIVQMPEIRSKNDVDPAWTRQMIEENRDIIKGIKIRAIYGFVKGLGLEGFKIAKKIASDFDLPLVMHIGDHADNMDTRLMDDFTRSAASLMEKGDILCHIYTWGSGGLISNEGAISREIIDARKRGVILDACHGGWNFSFVVARKSIEKGFLPDVISTDLNYTNAHAVQSLLVTMSKFLNLGLTIEQVIAMTTVNAAKALGEETRWGSLKTGMAANIAVMELVEGEFVFSDGMAGNRLQGNVLLEPRMVFQNGVQMPCCSRYNTPHFNKKSA